MEIGWAIKQDTQVTLSHIPESNAIAVDNYRCVVPLIERWTDLGMRRCSFGEISSMDCEIQIQSFRPFDDGRPALYRNALHRCHAATVNH